jgi:Peptidoglycan-binding protein, CsiV
MNKLSLLGWCLMFAVFNQSVYADGGRFHIEVLVFSHSLPTTEVFDQVDSRIQWPKALTELAAYQQTGQKALKDGAMALFKQAPYQAIAHHAWLQPGVGNALLPVHIQSEDGRLDGFVQLSKTNPLELIVDLEQKSAQPDRSGKYFLYHINEKRLLRPNEVQYFDHPKIGVLAIVKGN